MIHYTRGERASGVKSRLAMNAGRGEGAAQGAASALPTLLNPSKMFDRGTA